MFVLVFGGSYDYPAVQFHWWKWKIELLAGAEWGCSGVGVCAGGDLAAVQGWSISFFEFRC